MPHHLEVSRNVWWGEVTIMAEVVAVRVQAILPTKQVDYTPELATVSLDMLWTQHIPKRNWKNVDRICGRQRVMRLKQQLSWRTWWSSSTTPPPWVWVRSPARLEWSRNYKVSTAFHHSAICIMKNILNIWQWLVGTCFRACRRQRSLHVPSAFAIFQEPQWGRTCARIWCSCDEAKVP